MPKIADVVQFRELNSDVPRAAVVTSVADDGTVGLCVLPETHSGQVPFVANEWKKVKQPDGSAQNVIANSDKATHGYAAGVAGK